MGNLIYRQFKEQIVAGSDAWVASDIRCMLVGSSSTYVPSVFDVHLDEAISGGLVELSTTGYTAGGKALTSKAVIHLPTPPGAIGLDADNAEWLPLGTGFLTASAALVYVHTGTDSTSDLIAWIDSIAPISLFGANVTVEWSPSGVLTIA